MQNQRGRAPWVRGNPALPELLRERFWRGTSRPPFKLIVPPTASPCREAQMIKRKKTYKRTVDDYGGGDTRFVTTF